MKFAVLALSAVATAATVAVNAMPEPIDPDFDVLYPMGPYAMDSSDADKGSLTFSLYGAVINKGAENEEEFYVMTMEGNGLTTNVNGDVLD